jgi:hypothetical protein
MSDCSKLYKEYGGRSASFATSIGVLDGIAGLVGAGGFWDATSSGAIDNIANDYKNLQQNWNEWMTKEQNNLTEYQKRLGQEQTQFMQTVQDFTDEILDEKITKNTLFIQILFSIIIIILIYLIVL